MENTELIAELRGHILSVPLTLLRDAADALEADEKRIAELSLDNKMLKNTIDADKGVMLDRIRFLEAQMPKEGEWVAEPMTREKFYNDPYLSAKCSICGANSRERGRYCPNCGAKMRTGDGLSPF